MKAKQPLIIRADASTEIGTGHVMRCLALAQAWQEQNRTVIVVTALPMPTGIRTRLVADEVKVIQLDVEPGSYADAEQTAQFAHQIEAQWLVVDGYHFGADYQKIIKDNTLKLLFVDDYGHAHHYYADIVLNQNIYATRAMYPNREPSSHLLLGTKYVLLRREFWPWRSWQRQTPAIARKVLVTLGGGDPDNQTLKVIHALQQVSVDNLEVVVVVGSSNPHLNTLETAIRHSPFAIQLVQNVTNMPELIAWADVAVSAGGSTCWELAFMGLPTLILVIADNQREIATRLDQVGMAVNLGWFETVTVADLAKNLSLLLNDPERWQQMSRNGGHLVDGDGSKRTIRAMQGNSLIQLRPVTREDCKLIYEWANDPIARQNAFSSEPIAWETHVAWFERKLNDPDCIHYIALDDQNNNIGQIRFDIENDSAVVSVSIGRRKRGHGYGTKIIKQGVEMLMKTNPAENVEAFVKVENKSSVRAFEKAGFFKRDRRVVKGFDSFCFIWGKD